MSSPLTAIQPQISATVSASAGTGKTWMLVSRIIRLLLAGAKPDAILAITFTRKAAAEMQSRLASRLFEFAAADDTQLQNQLRQIQAPTDAQTLNNARNLYEKLLHARQTVRASTFHSFCQDILRRFPLDAGIAPGFELVEDTVELRQEAWDLMVREATLQPDAKLARQLDSLLDYCNGAPNTQQALMSFLEHRSDWWAYTEGKAKPVSFATEHLEGILNVNPESDPLTSLDEPALLNDVTEYSQLLSKHPIKTNAAAQSKALNALQSIHNRDYEPAFHTLYEVFFTQTGKPRVKNESQTQAKKMGEAGQVRFLELHQSLCTQLQEIRRQRSRLHLYSLCSIWYALGQHFLDGFQRLKSERRLLDFGDLEWKTYILLNHSDNAHWVQYKLDQRIDHLLIDEFQDTNPTQWQLIIPLLEELAAGESERQRSVFLVGDHKQSIYRFRRAAPELFDAAQHWLQQSLDAINQPLATSWRSAPAIMQCVNRVFADGPLSERIHQFTPHDTHRKDLWGVVEVLPLITPPDTSDDLPESPSSLRNPLIHPRAEGQDTRHYEEGKLIAAKIKALLQQPDLIASAGQPRPLSYNDVMILLRHRTHAHAYEKALREALIPYTGAERGTLLDTLESRDMVALLETLVTPYDNLALATVLRSPLFSCSNEQLLLVAGLQQGTWLQRLQVIASQNTEPELQQAHRLLSQWSTLAGKLPVHDLLDKVYAQGNVLNRYEAAYPDHLKQRVRANLTRFLELALEVDSGRYPSIGHFLSRLKTLRDATQNGPDEIAAVDSQAKVQIMTIHASKGMEAPVVFLVDACNTSSSSDAYQCIVQWPAGKPRPQRFLLTPPKKQQDDVIQALLEENQKAEAKEEANLLYVALTRAKQYLFISGCQPSRGNDLGWYGQVRDQLRSHMPPTAAEENLPIVISSGEPPATATSDSTVSESPIPLEPLPNASQLCGPFSKLPRLREIAPSHETGGPARTNEQTEGLSNTLDEDKQTRGIVIHKLLQLLSEQANEQYIAYWINTEFGLDINATPVAQWLQEAKHVIGNPEWSQFFDSAHYEKAFNEAPIMYQLKGNTVHGFIDRLILTDTKIILLDYKTHILHGAGDIETLTTHYRPQLNLYRQGVAKCWPDKEVECYLLFTHAPACLRQVAFDQN